MESGIEKLYKVDCPSLSKYHSGYGSRQRGKHKGNIPPERGADDSSSKLNDNTVLISKCVNVQSYKTIFKHEMIG